MMKREFRTFACFALVIANFAMIQLQAITREQIIPIQKGWNAIFLEVHPEDPEPATVFSGTSVEIAATFYTPVSTAQFITNPGADLLKQTGWGVWYAEKRADAFLSSLHSIYGQRAYLLFSTSDFIWKVSGSVLPPETLWTPDAFNFVGFAVHPQAGPTFAQFFAGSKAHKTDRIYRLVAGAWKRVVDPSAETIRSGEAFWIFCQGSSTFPGPLGVETITRKGLILSSSVNAINLRNNVNYPVSATIEHLPSGPNPVALSIVITALGEGALMARDVSTPLPDGAWLQRLPALESGETLKVPFEARLVQGEKTFRSSILKISSDTGTEIYIPVVSTRPELEEK
jgi:hypothetical protein